MLRFQFSVLSCLFAAAVAAAPLAPAAKAEIDALLSRLETSGCQFHRNGSWHNAADAKAHLLAKLKYFEDRGAVQSAEQFIELAASSSSVSGRAYLVKCESGAAVPSSVWLQSQLQLIRSAARPTTPK
jgi:hypothetical protein